MNITEVPVYLRPLIECKADVEHLIALCDERYIFNKLGWINRGYINPGILRDLEIVRMRFRDRKTYKAIGDEVGLSQERVRQVICQWELGFKHPKVLKKMKEYKHYTKDYKSAEWNRRVAQITDITGE